MRKPVEAVEVFHVRRGDTRPRDVEASASPTPQEPVSEVRIVPARRWNGNLRGQVQWEFRERGARVWGDDPVTEARGQRRAGR